MIQSFGSETIFRWEEWGKNHTLGAKESNPGCHGCLIPCSLWCMCWGRRNSSVSCMAACMLCGSADEEKEKGIHWLYNRVQSDSRIMITCGKHLICSYNKSMTNERGHYILHKYYGGTSYDKLLSVSVVCSLGSTRWWWW